MPMFDDPNKELSRMQEELLSGDDNDDLAGLDDLLKDYEPTVLEDLPEEKPAAPKPRKAPAVTKEAAALSEMLLDEDEDMEPAQPKEKGIGGLIALCIAETVAIVGLLAWWFLCLR